MQVHIFKATGRVFGFTTEAAGANLPQNFGAWTPFKSIELIRDQPTPGVDVNECLDDIDRFGFHLTDAHVRITEQAI